MKTDDLTPLWQATALFVVFDFARNSFWFNRAAEGRFEPRDRDLLVRQITDGACPGLDIEHAKGQTDNVPARVDLPDAVFHGFLRRLDDDRMILELMDHDAPPIGGTGLRSQVHDAPDEPARLAADAMRHAERNTGQKGAERQQVDLVAPRMSGGSIDTIDELQQLVDLLDQTSQREGGVFEAEIGTMRRRLEDRRLHLEEIEEIADLDDSAPARDVVRLRPLLGIVLSERYGQRPGVAKNVDIGDIPDIRGIEIVARRFLRHLVASLVPQDQPDALAFRLRARTGGDRATLVAESDPATLSPTESARRDRASRSLERAGARQNWKVSANPGDDGSLSVTIEAPIAELPDPPPVGGLLD